ncbi:MAG: hypothetical protein NTW52_13165 [Planctomycetota bacterium]|nr:hypothetical protein [Planctomycetota bacterium]
MKLPLSELQISSSRDCNKCQSWPLPTSQAACHANVISTIEGSDKTQRLVLCRVSCDVEGQCVELQRQSWSDSVGWFTQSRVRIAKEEINFLRSALGSVSTAKNRTAVSDIECESILRFPAQHSA